MSAAAPTQLALFADVPPPAGKRPAPDALSRLARRMAAEAIRRHDPQIAAWALVLQAAIEGKR